MTTDEERRHVARKLRLGGRPSLVKLMAYLHCGGNELFGRLADLIEPTSDPTGRGVDSVYDWCRERLEGADGAEDELYCSIMRAIEDYRHPERVTAHTVRAVDRDSLLELADNLSGDTLAVPDVYGTYLGGYVAACQDVARRIREVLGVVA